jgi:hypothetical protein
VSSTYRILCLSHDPALTVGEYSAREEAEGAIRDGVEDHPRCDLLIGRYSYPLVEVGCPRSIGRNREGPNRHTVHGATQWVDVVWLRLLAAVQQSGIEPMQALTREAHLSCWSPERLRRLRDELGVPRRDSLP